MPNTSHKQDYMTNWFQEKKLYPSTTSFTLFEASYQEDIENALINSIYDIEEIPSIIHIPLSKEPFDVIGLLGSSSFDNFNKNIIPSVIEEEYWESALREELKTSFLKNKL